MKPYDFLLIPNIVTSIDPYYYNIIKYYCT